MELSGFGTGGCFAVGLIFGPVNHGGEDERARWGQVGLGINHDLD